MDIELLELQNEYLNDLPGKLDLIYELLINIEKDDNIDESLTNLKGIIHSIKGASGSYELSFLSDLCHNFEDSLILLESSNTKQEGLINSFHYFELLREFSENYTPGESEDFKSYYDKLSDISKSFKKEKKIVRSSPSPQSIEVIICGNDKFFQDAISLAISKLNTNISFSNSLDLIDRKKGDPKIDFLFLIMPKSKDFKILEKPGIKKNFSDQINIISLTSESISLPKDHLQIKVTHQLVRDIKKFFLNLLQKKNTPSSKRPDKILFVDDDEAIHPLIKIAFKGLKNVEIHYCLSAKEAKSDLEAFRPDLILLDSMMPDISGKEFKKSLGQDPDLKNIPVVFLTGLDSAKEIAELKKLGAIDVITKPFKIKELAGQILDIYSKI